ncbi:type I restriction modification DNA specificity domain protein [Acinetobacter sp. 1542444]|uniref:restriction endonuclease subunit S n=1 Tax=Acinetobacter sp. 1542444 TaxID=1310681 RepID=UPI000448666C|nr:restriction endonuclease subunit S [Acinetobacter sp. 1542444]EXE62371.1 type I restriction modification DNA specificity domain protein [Acinetobacter sp. 1542444]
MMIQQNLFNIQDEIDTPVGYKKTEVGIIPSDWETPKFGEICTLINGRGFKPYEWSKRGLPIIRIQNLNGSDDFNYYEGPYDPKIFIENGQLLFAWSGSRGTSFGPHIWKGQNALLNYHTWKLNINHSKVDDKYFYHILKSLTKIIEDSAHGASALVHTQKGEMEQFDIPLPPSRIEQEKIATVLSDTDVLISELEKLIEKKQAIKTATMQQLLTGKTRLPEFALRDDGMPKSYKDSELGQIPEDWDAFEINEVVENIIDYRGRTPKKLGMDWGGGNIVALSAGNVRKGYIDFGAECYLGSELLYKKWMCNGEAQKDDIAFTMEAPLGNVALIPDHSKYILSQRTILLQINRQEFDPHFIFHLLMSNEFEKYISDQATGSTAQGVKRSLFEKLKLVLPIKLSEQKSISQILDDFDFEIEKLKQKLKKLQLIKQGMMQELLTGKTRLV